MNFIKIGRADDNTIQVPESYDRVSNYHAEILYEGGKLLFCDHSSNGTIINGQKIKKMSVHIFQDDVIELPGGYCVLWDDINKYFEPVMRPEIHRNPHDIEHSHAMSGSIVSNNIPLPQEVGRQTVVRNNNESSMGNETIKMNQSNLGGRQTMSKNSKTHTGSQITGLYGSLGGSRADGGLTDEELNRQLGRWNWGAFFLTWIWGVSHKVRWTLVVLVTSLCLGFTLPQSAYDKAYGTIYFILLFLFSIVNIGIAVYLGFNATKIAWNNGCYNSIADARVSIRRWNIAGVIVFAIGLTFEIVIYFI